MLSRTRVARPSIPLRKSTGLVATITRTAPDGPITGSPSAPCSAPLCAHGQERAPAPRRPTPPAQTVLLPRRHAGTLLLATDGASQTIAAATIHAAGLPNRRCRRSQRFPQQSEPCPRRSTSADDRLR